jgi:hypothetical protein
MDTAVDSYNEFDDGSNQPPVTSVALQGKALCYNDSQRYCHGLLVTR